MKDRDDSSTDDLISRVPGKKLKIDPAAVNTASLNQSILKKQITNNFSIFSANLHVYI